MKSILRTVRFAAFLLIASQLMLVNSVLATEGKDLFTASKCNMCHSLKTQTITTKGKAPDLSKIGGKHPADWMAKYLKKQEKMNGKDHMKAFAGSDADLTSLTNWLATLK